MNLKIVSIGGINQDIIFDSYSAEILTKKNGQTKSKYIAFDFGSKNSANNITRTYGGAALNSSVILKGFGFNAMPWSIVGDDLSGHEILYYLGKKKINKKLVKISKTNKTALAFIINLPEHNEHILFVARQALNDLRITPKEIVKLKTDWLYLSSLRGSFANHNIETIFNNLPSDRTKIFWNPGSQQLTNFKILKRYLNQVDILSINLAEAKLLVTKSLRDVKKIITAVYKLGAQKVIITNGENGSYYYDGKDFLHQPIIKTKVLNTTGAGDAFNAGFLAGYINYHGEIKKSLLLGAQNAAAVLKTLGAHQGALNKRDI